MSEPERQGDGGSATLAAVLAAACFAMLAAQIARTSRSEIRSANAEVVHARLAADSEARLALAIDHLAADDPSARWDFAGQTYPAAFDDAKLEIRIEDERGKLPLNTLTQAQVRALFAQAGADPQAVDGLVEAFLDARDPNRRRAGDSLSGGSTPRLPVASTAAAPGQGGGGFRTVAELASLPGMTPELYAAIAPSATIDAGDRPFDARTATPLALQVMSGAGGGVAAIERQRELSGQRPALALDTQAPPDVVGRVLTIRVAAEDGAGGRVQDATLVQLTGHPDRPYVVRERF